LMEGVLVESGSVESEGGRPTTLLSVNKHYGYFFGIEIDEATIRIDLYDMMLGPVETQTIPLNLIENPPETIARTLATGVNKILAQLGLSTRQIIGVGIGLPGIVDLELGVTVFAPNWNWRDVPFRQILGNEMDSPFLLENNANAMAVAEDLYGKGARDGHRLVLCLDHGIGVGIIQDGRLYRGVGNSAGEWGHTVVNMEGPRCRCGSRGCLETYIGAAGIIKRYFGSDDAGMKSHEDPSALIRSIVDAAGTGDMMARRVIDETARYLGLGIANLINLFNPGIVNIGGWVGQVLGPTLLPDLRKIVAEYALPQPLSHVSIDVCSAGGESVARGAAALVMQSFLENAGPSLAAIPRRTLPRSRKKGQNTVRILAVSGLETDVLIKYASDFENKSGIVASIEQVTRPKWGEKKAQELLYDTGNYDVVMVGGGDDLLWVKLNGHVRNLNEYLSSTNQRELMHREFFQKDGKLFGIPQYFNFPMLYFRKDLLDDPSEARNFEAEYGRPLRPPTTFREMEEVAQFFHRPPEMNGFFVGGVEWSVFLDYTYFIFGNSANFGDLATGALTLNTPESKDALTALTKMVRFNPPGWQTLSFFDGERLFKSGKIFMYQNWNYATKSLMEAMPGKVGLSPSVGEKHPGEHLGAFVAVIPRAAKHPDLGGKFISWMMGSNYQKIQTIETGNLPVRGDVLRDADVQKSLVGLVEYEKALPFLTYQHTTWFNELSAGIAEAIGKVFRDEMKPEQALDWLQNEKFKGRRAIE
jgi:multiple sugar transport system substrate-binding protein